jgi:prepilin-type N-terminal cleavage/methylation domain-containing protein
MRPTSTHRCPDRQRRGFTLVELIATIVILSVLGSVASSFLLTAINAYTSSSIRAQLHGEASVAMERMVREFRKIPKNTSASGNAPLVNTVTSNSITWNGTSTLSMSGTQLMFADAGATARALLNDVTSFSVQAYDESNSALATSLSGSACDSIRRIQVTITMQRYGVTETLRTRTFIRCTMTGNS